MTAVDIQGILSLVAAIGGPIGAYWGAISAVRVELARQEERLAALVDRVERLESQPRGAVGNY